MMHQYQYQGSTMTEATGLITNLEFVERWGQKGCGSMSEELP